MKILTGIFYYLLIIMGAMLLAALFAPSSKMIRRTTTIDAPKEVVFLQIANLEKWQKWDAWFAKDVAQNRVYKGKLGDNKYSTAWTSKNVKLGNGNIQVENVKNNESIQLMLTLGTKIKLKSAPSTITLTEVNGSTRVEWEVISNLNYPFRVLNYFMDKLLQKDMQKGLAKMKTYIESSSLEELGVQANGVSIVELGGASYAALKRENIQIAELTDFYATSFGKIYDYLKLNKISPRGPATGLYYTSYPPVDNSVVAAAVSTSAITQANDSFMRIDGTLAKLGKNHISVLHNGGYYAKNQVHIKLSAWAALQKKTLRYPIKEEFLKGPLDGADTATYVTRVTYFFD